MMIYLLSLMEDERDRNRFARLYDICHTQMEKAALSILKNPDDAEDALQSAFVQIIRHFEELKKIPREELPYWCISTTENEARMILRSKSRFELVPPEDWANFAEETETVETLADYHALAALIRKLPETYRSVLEMKLLLGYTDAEAARRLGISETAVSSRASRGRELLRKLAERGGFQA